MDLDFGYYRRDEIIKILGSLLIDGDLPFERTTVQELSPTRCWRQNK